MPRRMRTNFFDIFDANSDDYLTPNEIPAHCVPLFRAAGIKIEISRTEFGKLFRHSGSVHPAEALKPEPGKEKPKKSVQAVGSELIEARDQPPQEKRRTTAPESRRERPLGFPTDYRSWIFVGSNIGLGYKAFPGLSGLAPRFGEGAEVAVQQPEQKAAKMGDFHNVYINPEAYEAYIKSGKFPDKTVLVMDVYKAMDREPKGIVCAATFLESSVRSRWR